MGLAVAFLSAAGLAASGIVWAQTPPCGALTNSYGPFDYRTSKAELKIVEDYHFTPDVETLRHGNTATVGGDIDYTLRASPNHHRALMSMVNLAVRTKSDKPLGPRLTVDCYFDRAMRFANDDGAVRIIYGIYLYRIGKKVDARRVLEDARKIDDGDPNLHYNLGVVYFDLGDKANALASAQKAYQLGAQLPGLKEKLRKAGIWKDAPAGAVTGGITPSQGSERAAPAN
jgi:Flp pilus assembly protein TadD